MAHVGNVFKTRYVYYILERNEVYCVGDLDTGF